MSPSAAGGVSRRPWIGLYGIIALAWLALYVLAARHPTPVLGALDPDFRRALWLGICAARPSLARFPDTMLMWGLMSAAMMLPTAIPFLRSYQEIAASARAPSAVSAYGAALGYLVAWLGFSVAASGLQVALTANAQLSAHGVSLTPWLTSALLLGAGLYQLSPAKRMFLGECRHPLAFLLSSWRSGAAGAAKLGLTHGLRCIGCCWALMALAFVGGTMNLVWMGAAPVLMALEKLNGPRGRVRIAIGAALIAAGGFAAASAR